ncbi:hypothetical protein, partial [Xanthomonas euvesicatoria]|uniref:hypothetical protein n=1 Tax=Xanthomonas euvesicatoria TaxID=456327 RepID=UPI001C44AD7A
KATIVAQVGHFYFGAVGQFYIGANNPGCFTTEVASIPKISMRRIGATVHRRTTTPAMKKHST